MTDFELARRHYVYNFDTTSKVTITNDTMGVKLKRLGGVLIKSKTYTHVRTERAYEQYYVHRCSTITSNIIYI